MTAPLAIALPDRGIVTVGGPDRRDFLQGLVSNDVARAGPDRALWAAFLSPQGKYRHDFFLADFGERYLLDCEADRLMDLGRGLSKFKLRSDVALGIAEGWHVTALIGAEAPRLLGLAGEPGAAGPFEGGVAFVDPRLAAMGARLMTPDDPLPALAKLGAAEGTRADYDAVRIPLGLPDGARDIEPDKGILLEAGFAELKGVDWDKGCWMGQELTARTKYRGLIKKRLMPIVFDGQPPAPGTAILAGGKEVGETRSAMAGAGLALIRLDRWRAAEEAGTPLEAGPLPVSVAPPDWVELPTDG